MIEELGYVIHDEILSLSDMQEFVIPFLLNLKLALCLV